MSNDDRFSVDRSQGVGHSLTVTPEAGSASTPIPQKTTDSLAPTRAGGPGLSDPFEAPTQIGRFRDLELVGHGGFGFVYRAYDPELNRSVALKIPKPGLDAGPFLKEARSAAALKHPNIVTVYDVGQTETGLPFIALEYVEGPTLSMLMRQQTPTPREAARIVAQVARAVHFAHRAGFVHRDLKPGNILMDRDGTAKVTDFGLAFHESAPLPDDEEVAGTPAYMAPEQVTSQAGQYDGRTDIWALGVILYQLLSGRLPFSAHSERETLYRQICQRDPKPLRQIDDSIPVELAELCRRCLAKSPADRPATAQDVSEALDRFCESSSDSTAPPQGLLTPSPTPRRPVAARVAGTVAVTLTALCGLVLLLWWQAGGLNAPVAAPTPAESPRSIDMPESPPLASSREPTVAEAYLAADTSGPGGLPDPSWETFKGPYQPLFWRVLDNQDSYAFDPIDGRLAIRTATTALLSAGELPRDSVTIRTELQIDEWKSPAGIFWGARKGDNGVVTCSAIRIGRHTPDFPFTIWYSELEFEPDRSGTITMKSDLQILSNSLPVPQSSFATLQLTLLDSRLTEVRFNGKVVIASEQLQRFPVSTYPIATTAVGLVAERGRVLFRSFQLRE